MRRLLLRIVAVLTVALLLVGILPGRHLCALAASGGEAPQEAHGCCKKLQADSVVSDSVVSDSATAPSHDAAPDPLCAGSCCDSVDQAGLSVSPDLALFDAGLTLAGPPAPPVMTRPAAPALDVSVRGPRGPPPKSSIRPIFLTNRVLLR